MFEIVHTLTEWYDGPRRGIADYQGKPHLFESEWEDGARLDAETFLLQPIDQGTFSLALEDWAIWRRWKTAFDEGKTPHETHPSLPEDAIRHLELESELATRLSLDPVQALRKVGKFRVRQDPDWSGHGFRPLEVQWDDPN